MCPEYSVTHVSGRTDARWGPFGPWVQTIVPPHQFTDFIEYPIIPAYLNQNFLSQKYVVEGLSCDEIAAQIASARSTVLKYLKLYDIPVREAGTNIRRRNLQYGIKLRQRKESVHRREVETLKRIYKLKQQGFSYREIAQVLNSLAIPTKTKRAKWQGRTVFGLLKRFETNAQNNELVSEMLK